MVVGLLQDVKYFQTFNSDDMENMKQGFYFLNISFFIYSLMHMQFPL
jgi:hypothetical protein